MKKIWLYTAVLASSLLATERAEADLFVGNGVINNAGKTNND